MVNTDLRLHALFWLGRSFLRVAASCEACQSKQKNQHPTKAPKLKVAKGKRHTAIHGCHQP